MPYRCHRPPWEYGGGHPFRGLVVIEPGHSCAGLCAQYPVANDLAGQIAAEYLDAGRMPMPTLSPSMAFKDGEPYMVFGTPGGDQQDQWSCAFFLRHAVHGMNLQEAIDAPAWHVDHFPASFWPRATRLNELTLESRFAPDQIDALRQQGHQVHVGPPWSES